MIRQLKFWHIVLLVLILSIFSCGRKKPVEPPPPPPPVEEICGNGDCAGKETPESCPQDCKKPGPEPEPEPDHKCDPQKPYLPRRGIANYGLLGQVGETGVDFHKQATDVRDSKIFNTISIHGNSFWGQLAPEGNQPFLYDKKRGVYLLKDAQPNPEYFARKKQFLRENACHGISVHDTLFDQYFGLNGSGVSYNSIGAKYGLFSKHPFTNNDIGVNWSSAKYLYFSWDGGGLLDSDFSWLKWTGIDEDPSSIFECECKHDLTKPQFKGHPTKRELMCRAIRKAYLEPNAKIYREVQREFPNWRFSYKLCNEEKGHQEWVRDPKTGIWKWHANRGKSLGGETKIQVWVYEQIWLAAGFTKAQLEPHIDTLAYKGFDNSTEYGWVVEWGNMYKTYQWLTAQGISKPPFPAIFEIHSIESMNVVKLWSSPHSWINPDGSKGSAPGIFGPKVYWSEDGKKEDVNFLKNSWDLMHSNVERAEMKTFTAPPNKCWDDQNMKKSWERCFAEIRAAIEKQKGTN